MKQNKINYYNTDDEIQFQKLDDFRKFNKNITMILYNYLEEF